jgi:uncharacterized protein YjbI with pentapeptide repeats
MPEAATNTQDSAGPNWRPAVVARARRAGTEARLPIEKFILPLIAEGRGGVVRLVSPPGGGKTTAMKYLNAILPADAAVEMVDEDKLFRASGGVGIWLVTFAAQLKQEVVEILEICPWTLDDCMEYLAATHRGQCASVLERLSRDASIGTLKGSPQLLTLVMDAMAGDSKWECARDILRDHAWGIMPQGFREAWNGGRADKFSVDHGLEAWWRHEAVRLGYTAQWIVEELCQGRVPGYLRDVSNMDLVPDIAAAVWNRPAALEQLENMIVPWLRGEGAAMAASILLCTNPDWRPKDGRGLNLKGARLPSVRWTGIDLSSTFLDGAWLIGGDLSGACLNECTAGHAKFNGTNLRGAKMEGAKFWFAGLAGACLGGVVASKAVFTGADLTGADLRDGEFVQAVFNTANFQQAHCEDADFSFASMRDAKVAQADFSRANFGAALLARVYMRGAVWAGATFDHADLRQCNLEGLQLASPDFRSANLTGSLLTGSRFPGANFEGASLQNTGLAEVEWENADLRGVDFTHASFHLGSSRSGLVGSVIPCEGSKTGFYTDEFNEQDFKSPEEIRKACLRGANFLGAKIEGTDFYLVDVRGATCSDEQREHFRRTGAILVSRVS